MSTENKLLVIHLNREGLKSLKELANICIGHDYLKVLLNFEKVSSLGGGEIGILIDFQSHLEKYGGQLVVCRAGKEVLTMIRIMELENSLTIVSTQEDGISQLGGPGKTQEVPLENPSHRTIIREKLSGAGGTGDSSSTSEGTPSSMPVPPKGEFALQVNKRDLAGVGTLTCFVCAGDLNMMNVFALEVQIQEAIQADRPLVVFDFQSLNYINSSGMGTMVKAADKVKNKGGFIGLVNLPEKIEGLFRMLGLLSTLNVFNSYGELDNFCREEFSDGSASAVSEPVSQPEEPSPEPETPEVEAPPEPQPRKKPTKLLRKPADAMAKKIKEVPGLKVNKVADFTLVNGQSGVVLESIGAIDTLTCRYFEQVIQGHADEGTKFIVVDFRKIEYINSTGLGTLVKIHDHLEEQNGMIGLVELSVKIYDLFEMLGISQVVYIKKDLKECQEFFNSKFRKEEPAAAAPVEEPAPEPVPVEKKAAPKAAPEAAPPKRVTRSIFLKPKAGPKEEPAPAPALTGGAFFVDSDKQILGNLEVEWSTQRLDGRSVLRVSLKGSIDTISVGRLEKIFNEFILEKGVTALLMDFGGIDYLNSTGMGLLVKMADLLRSKSGEVATINTSIKVKNLLDMLGISYALNLCNTEDEAYEILVGSAPAAATAPAEEEVPAEEAAPEEEEVPIEEALRIAEAALTAKAAQAEEEATQAEEEAVKASVGDSELNVESELINLIQESEVLEKQGKYKEAIEILQKAMEKAGYTDALMNKIQKLKDKIKVTDEWAFEEIVEKEASDVVNLLSDSGKASAAEDFIEVAIAGAATEEMSREDIDEVLKAMSKKGQEKPEEGLVEEESEIDSELSTISDDETLIQVDEEPVFGASLYEETPESPEEPVFGAPSPLSDLERLTSEIDQDLDALSKEAMPTEDISFESVQRGVEKFKEEKEEDELGELIGEQVSESAAPPDLDELVGEEPTPSADLDELVGEEEPTPSADLDELVGEEEPTPSADLDELVGEEEPTAAQDPLSGMPFSGLTTEPIDFNQIKNSLPSQKEPSKSGFDLDELTGEEAEDPSALMEETPHLPGLASSAHMAQDAFEDSEYEHTHQMPGIEGVSLPDLDDSSMEEDHTQHLESLQATLAGIGSEDQSGGGVMKGIFLLFFVIFLGLALGVGGIIYTTTFESVSTKTSVKEEKIEKIKKRHQALDDLYGFGMGSNK